MKLVQSLRGKSTLQVLFLGWVDQLAVNQGRQPDLR